MNTDGIKYIPNAFYDMMVFIVPTAQICAFSYIGILGFDLSNIMNIDTTFLIALVLSIIILSYEYGRMAEALSAYLVQAPLRFLSKHTKLFNSPDFLRERDEIYKILGLKECYDGRKGDKWAIYLFAFTKMPAIGADLLKRYAWEKLSRNSAFTYAILFIISLIKTIICLFLRRTTTFLPFRFGNGSFLMACGLLGILTYIEYYRRNVWNFDLLTKAIPVIIS